MSDHLNLATLLVGPLAGPECRRALGRGWLILVRALAALAILGAAMIVLWVWWMSQAADPDFLPYQVLRYGLGIVEGMLLTIALVMGPAVLAGSIAGEKERGVMALLLTTCVSSREIITGRLAGKLTQVAMILLAGVPAVVALATLAGMHLPNLAVMLALPAAVALGGGGLAVLASTVSRRGRDALLTVYLVDVLFLLSPAVPSLGGGWGTFARLSALNPFICLVDLVWNEETTTSLISIAFWLITGMIATTIAAWRLRPASLRPLEGERKRRRGLGRVRGKLLGRVPPVDDERPMLWKEMHVEHGGALGGIGWLLGAFLVVLLGGAGLLLGGLLIWELLTEATPGRMLDVLNATIGGSLIYIGCLIQWAVGLRAAVTIASERERGTWDALLTSPLEGREIIRAKLWGSLNALRWLFAATLLAWTVAAFSGELSVYDYAKAVASTSIIAVFMTAVGVRTSLSSPTATRAMTLTIGIWLASWVIVSVLAAVAIGVAFLLIAATAWITAGSPAPPPWIMSILAYSWPVTVYGFYLVAAILIVADTRLRFDRLAGRMTGGRVETAFDGVLHGRPKPPWRRRAAGKGTGTVEETAARAFEEFKSL